ncbi:gliding motility lipoprotein GldB [Psychroflexus tropicus]|uniref:gliding motility lipoprotein GldB n=1 Tax=Psychroflexus tropicus TaxID=197345 RepID=UPI00035C8C56|nr:gliding motility lipoprotein GldB [Psychroflexus tropicus]
MRFPLILLSLSLLLSACGNDSSLNAEAETIDIELKVNRFDLEFAETHPKNFESLRREYPELFSNNVPDSLWIAKMKSDLQQEINTEVQQEFLDFGAEKRRIEHLFQYIKYYYPNYEIPEVFTLAEEVNYRQKLILGQDALLISLDNYLGKDHKFYKGLPQYIAFQQDKKFLISDIIEAFAMQRINPKRSRTFLSNMVYYGKILYLKDRLMPFEPDTAKIYYSKEELLWAEENEQQIWSFFVERDLIYSTDNRLEDRFINLAPYSKFYLELDNESAPRIGQYIGWQIVRAYMNKYPKTSLKELIDMKSDLIFTQSKYKP